MAQVFSCEFCEILRKPFFIDYLRCLLLCFHNPRENIAYFSVLKVSFKNPFFSRYLLILLIFCHGVIAKTTNFKPWIFGEKKVHFLEYQTHVSYQFMIVVVDNFWIKRCIYKHLVWNRRYLHWQWYLYKPL